jgi:hypothetical protein
VFIIKEGLFYTGASLLLIPLILYILLLIRRPMRFKVYLWGHIVLPCMGISVPMILNSLNVMGRIEHFLIIFDFLVLPLLLFFLVQRTYQLMKEVKDITSDEKILRQIKAFEDHKEYRDPRYIYFFAWIVFVFFFIYHKLF